MRNLRFRVSGFLIFSMLVLKPYSNPSLIDIKVHALCISFFKPQPTMEKENTDKQNEKKKKSLLDPPYKKDHVFAYLGALLPCSFSLLKGGSFSAEVAPGH